MDLVIPGEKMHEVSISPYGHRGLVIDVTFAEPAATHSQRGSAIIDGIVAAASGIFVLQRPYFQTYYSRRRKLWASRTKRRDLAGEDGNQCGRGRGRRREIVGTGAHGA